jgi:Ca-activated chloride channel family protein
MFNRHVYENSRAEGVGLLEVVDDGEGKPSEQALFVPLKRTELQGQVVGPLASLRLVQTYQYSREECDKVLEAAYRFPLPGDAAVTHVRVHFGDVEIDTELKEREQAEAEYQEAVEAQKQAALLTRESPDVFTLRVAGIKPDEAVVVETHYVQLARPYGERPSWLLRVPLTTAPRYVREDELESRHAQGQPLALLRDPGHRFALDLDVCAAGEISSPTHQIDVLPQDDVRSDQHDWAVRLHDGEVVPDRDFVLIWTPYQEPQRPTLNLMLHEDEDDGMLYFLALVAPPSEYETGTGVPREITLLVDHSGSMSGAKWEASDWTVNSFLNNLDERDAFALGLFHNTTKWFKKQPLPASEKNLQAAARYLDKNRDSGGTNLGVALEQALNLPRADHDEYARHILVITDAQVSDAARIFRLADQEAERGRRARRRISVLCIDAAPNSFLANELAERGGGVAHFLTSDPDQGDITTALERVLVDWSEPVLAGLALEVDRAGGEASGREVLKDRGETVIDLGDLPCGRAVWVAGRVPADGETLTFRVTTPQESAAEGTAAMAQVDVTTVDADLPALKALFGARRLLGLEYLINARYSEAMLKEQLKRMGYDPKEIVRQQGTSVYAENALKAAQEALNPLLVRESLRYGVACAETAFVAVRKEAGEPVEARTIVPNALPSGWSEGFLSLGMGAGAPRGAAVMRSLGPTMAADAASYGTVKAMAQPLAEGRPRRRPDTEAEDTAIRRPKAGTVVIFSGEPVFEKGQAVLFDTTAMAGQENLPDQTTLSRIAVDFKAKDIDKDAVHGLRLLIFVGDMALPRATIRLADLVRGGGARPLNLRKRAGEDVRVVLSDSEGTWASQKLPMVTVRLTTK